MKILNFVAITAFSMSVCRNDYVKKITDIAYPKVIEINVPCKYLPKSKNLYDIAIVKNNADEEIDLCALSKKLTKKGIIAIESPINDQFDIKTNWLKLKRFRHRCTFDMENKKRIDWWAINEEADALKRDLPCYGTHMYPLLTAAANTTGPILEMGCGDFSTPLLHAICKPANRKLVTVETEQLWLMQFISFKSDFHKLLYLPVYEDDRNLNPKPELWDNIGNGVFWSVVFIDHRPGDRRILDIERLSQQAEIIVVHDTEEAGYGYEPALNSFKYRHDVKDYPTHTTLVSNFVDVTKLFEN